MRRINQDQRRGRRKSKKVNQYQQLRMHALDIEIAFSAGDYMSGADYVEWAELHHPEWYYNVIARRGTGDVDSARTSP
jgi:hypothetical protein